MKKQALIFLALLAISIIGFAQEPVDNGESKSSTELVSPMHDSIFFARFPNGSVPYPSPEAHELLSQVVGRKPLENIPENKISESYQMAMARHQERAGFEEVAYEDPCKAAKIFVVLTFITLRLMADDYDYDYFYWHNFHTIHYPPYYGDMILD